MYHQGNPKLRAQNIQLDYTESQINEVIRCSQDVIYFIKNYIHIVHLDRGLVKFSLYPYQENMIQLMQDTNRSIILAPRQSGKTQCMAAYLLYYILFQNDKTVAILANKEATAREILHRVKLMYENLPLWLQQGVIVWNKSSFELENGSRAISSSTSSSAIRGRSINCISLDSIITVKNRLGRIITLAIKSLLDSNLDGYTVNTPNGFKPFDGIHVTAAKDFYRLHYKGTTLDVTGEHKIMTTNGWIEAQHLNDRHYVITEKGPSRLIWNEHIKRPIEVADLLNVQDVHSFYANGLHVSNCLLIDEAAFVPHGIWEDFYSSVYPTVASSRNAKIILSSTPYSLNHYYKMWTEAKHNKNGFTPLQVHWNEVPGRDDHWKVQTIAEIGEKRFRQEFECQFEGSADTLIDGPNIQKLTFIDPIQLQYNEKFKIYESPKDDRKYVCFVDVAEGLEQDYSVIQVIDVSTIPYKQVAVFSDNTVKTHQFHKIVDRIGRFYKDALVVGENNSIGMEVLNNLNYDCEYENLFVYDDVFGIRMTKASKRSGNAKLKELIERDKLTLCDYQTIYELSTYIQKNQTYQAEEGKHDDHVTPFVLFAYFVNNGEWAENWLDSPTTYRQLNREFLNEVQDDLLVGYFSDGVDEVEM